MKKACMQMFCDIFAASPDVVCFAPGRVNLVGEHTDYNGGYVFPCAIDRGIMCAASKRNDGVIKLYSGNFPNVGVCENNLDSLSRTGTFADYPIAVIRSFMKLGHTIPHGFNVVFYGDLPYGAGLSSSAALETVTGVMLRALFDITISNEDIALCGQYAENNFIGVKCGIMDQFASAMGKSGSAILLNTKTLCHSYAPIPSNRVDIVIINSGVKHSLASSAYNERRQQCERALDDIKKVVDVDSLCSLTPEEFEKYSRAISDPVCRKRASHAVYENDRTKKAAAALNGGDLALFGDLMKHSHLSLQNVYEVSCDETDFLAQTANEFDGVYGARMTGGGFGGCTVNLLDPSKTTAFIDHITNAYIMKTGITAAAYVVKAGGGACVIQSASTK